VHKYSTAMFQHRMCVAAKEPKTPSMSNCCVWPITKSMQPSWNKKVIKIQNCNYHVSFLLRNQILSRSYCWHKHACNCVCYFSFFQKNQKVISKDSIEKRNNRP